MIVNTLIKILFFYFIFVLIRKFIRGASQMNEIKKQMQNQMNQQQGSNPYQNSKQTNSGKKEDVVEAEFRHL
jgi:predicted PurR-regulated permease PerM